MRKKLTSLSLLAFLGLSTAVFAQTKGKSKTVFTDENGNLVFFILSF